MSNKRKWFCPVLGAIMLSHFVFCLYRFTSLGNPGGVLWISHICTLIGGIGACLRNRFLISVALVACFGHHLFWMGDIFSWLLTGKFAVGVTSYLEHAGFGAWVQSSNHFFLVPMLLVLAALHGPIDKYAWIGAAGLFTCLVAISLVFLPSASNINCAHGPLPGLAPLITFMAGQSVLSGGQYVAFIIAFTTLANYLPANLFLRWAFSRYSDRHTFAPKKMAPARSQPI
jgi:hypothetical protein